MLVRNFDFWFLTFSAYNPESHSALRSAGVIPLLLKVYRSRNHDFFFFDAAIAIANIDPSNPEIDGDCELMAMMTIALQRTIDGLDFPVDSGAISCLSPFPHPISFYPSISTVIPSKKILMIYLLACIFRVRLVLLAAQAPSIYM